jgi:hypothetical protein
MGGGILTHLSFRSWDPTTAICHTTQLFSDGVLQTFLPGLDWNRSPLYLSISSSWNYGTNAPLIVSFNKFNYYILLSVGYNIFLLRLRHFLLPQSYELFLSVTYSNAPLQQPHSLFFLVSLKCSTSKITHRTSLFSQFLMLLNCCLTLLESHFHW